MNSTRNSKNNLEALVLIVVFALVCVSANAATRYVPSQYSTIQAAIDACNTGDTVNVAPDTYNGLGNRNIYFRGKAITVRSETGPENCIIDGEGYGAPGFLFTNAETENSVLDGFTITNFNHCGIYCYSSSPTIRNCKISNNTATYGGGIDCREYSHPTITSCVIRGNKSTTGGYGGGGIFCNWGCDPTISNCVITSNSAAYRGGGIYFYFFCHPKFINCEISKNTAYDGGGICHAMFGRLEIINCTVAENMASNKHGGLYLELIGGPITFSNSIFWGNTATNSSDQIFGGNYRVPTFSFCDIEGSGGSGGEWPSDLWTDGGGNIDVDPRFVDPSAGDYHLMPNSPCNNGGDPSGSYTGQTDIDGEPRVMNGQVDIGADECSEPPQPPCPPPPLEPWSFVQITDTHIRGEDARDSLSAAVLEICNLSASPHFVLVTGDIADIGCDLGCGGQYDQFNTIMEDLEHENIKYYCIPGNHDRIFGLGGYEAKIGLPGGVNLLPQEGGVGNYWFEHKGFMLIGLDTGPGTFDALDYLTDEQMLDLNSCASQGTCMPKIVFMHHPAAGGGGKMIVKNRADFLDWCDEQDARVVITGHTHEDVVCDRNGVDGWPVGETAYVQTPSCGKGDVGDRGYRIFDVIGGIVSERGVSHIQNTLDYYIKIKPLSPVDLHVYDSQGGHVGVGPSGEIERGIPRSFYLPHYSVETENVREDYPDKILIFDPTDDYLYEVVGTEEGTYGLDITSVSGGGETTFEAAEIPTSPGAKHVYAVDWGALSAGGEGVILEIDNNGDGFFEQMAIADNELSYDEFALQTETVVDFDPDTLNLKSKGKFVTVYIELPEDFDVSEIDLFSLELNELIPPLPKPIEIGDYDNDGINDLMVKFDRQELIEVLEPGKEQIIDLTGRLLDGRPIAGFDIIRVIDKGKNEESKGKNKK